jgi:hypothetical protein
MTDSGLIAPFFTRSAYHAFIFWMAGVQQEGEGSSDNRIGALCAQIDDELLPPGDAVPSCLRRIGLYRDAVLIVEALNKPLKVPVRNATG